MVLAIPQQVRNDSDENANRSIYLDVLFSLPEINSPKPAPIKSPERKSDKSFSTKS